MKKKFTGKVLSVLVTLSLTVAALSGCSSSAKGVAKDSSTDAVDTAESSVDVSTLDVELPESIIIGCMPDWPPYDYVDADGNVTGYDVAVNLEACRRLGIDVTFVAYEWDGLLPALESDRVQVVAAQIYRSEEREEKFYFSNYPYFKSEDVMIVRADSTAESVEDVIEQGLTFTCVAGELNEQYLKENGINFEYVEGSPQTQIDGIIAGHSDGFLSMWDTVNHILIESGEEGLLKPIGEPLASDFVYSVFQKNEQGAALAKAFGEVYKEMEADGTLTKLSEEYLSGTPVEGLSEGGYE